ncbi:MAG: NUDIX hydrolase [Chloroflexi bacterium]|nr:NUDIX hydrolase [Chloroflexota bacterium]
MPAATVVLLRAGPGGLEVLLTRRPATMAFAPDVHVFPGGRLDPSDRMANHPLARGLTARDAAARLGGTLAPAAALAHFVAAVRETLEETGIEVAARSLVPLSRWVTPASLVRRFDVRFFAAGVPADTDIRAPSSEVAASRWLTPADALAEARDGRLAMLLPTLVTFEQLMGHVDLASVRATLRVGPALDPPSITWIGADLARIDQRWAAGVAGRSATGWLVGRHELVLVDPADPTGVTSDAIDAAVSERGARLAGIALTGWSPEQRAGVELYAAGRGLPVAGAVGGLAPHPFTALRPEDHVPFGDILLIAESPSHAGPGALAYRLPDGRRLEGRFDDPVGD